MRYFTTADAKNASSLKVRSYQNARDILRDDVKKFHRFNSYDIFLSHTFSDSELVLGVKELLEDRGYSVYVDWIEDPHLDRSNVTKEVAQYIRDRIRTCKSLVFATSDNSSRSKWMPWELGYFDGYRPGKVSILPLLETESSTFKGQEYLSLYPIMGKNDYSYLQDRNLQIDDGVSVKTFSLEAA